MSLKCYYSMPNLQKWFNCHQKHHLYGRVKNLMNLEKKIHSFKRWFHSKSFLRTIVSGPPQLGGSANSSKDYEATAGTMAEGTCQNKVLFIFILIFLIITSLIIIARVIFTSGAKFIFSAFQLHSKIRVNFFLYQINIYIHLNKKVVNFLKYK